MERSRCPQAWVWSPNPIHKGQAHHLPNLQKGWQHKEVCQSNHGVHCRRRKSWQPLQQRGGWQEDHQSWDYDSRPQSLDIPLGVLAASVIKWSVLHQGSNIKLTLALINFISSSIIAERDWYSAKSFWMSTDSLGTRWLKLVLLASAFLRWSGWTLPGASVPYCHVRCAVSVEISENLYSHSLNICCMYGNDRPWSHTQVVWSPPQRILTHRVKTSE